MSRAGRWIVAALVAASMSAFADPGARAAAATPTPFAVAPAPAKEAATSPTQPGRLASTDAERDYARREAQHPQTAGFRGGDSVGIYIGGSAGLLVLLLLVLILLR